MKSMISFFCDDDEEEEEEFDGEVAGGKESQVMSSGVLKRRPKYEFTTILCGM